MISLDAFSLAARQIELDRAATARLPELFARKRQRLLSSPHAFLRGSAPLFYEILAARPELASGPEGEGWIVGDMHLENAGAFRTDKDRVVFNLNDFDDATKGPRRIDVLRLATSVLLAARASGCPVVESIALCEGAIGAYIKAAWGRRDAPSLTVEGEHLPEAIVEMMRKADKRSKSELLDSHAPEGHDGRRRFPRGEKYLELTASLRAAIPELVEAYQRALGDATAKWQVEDAALRVAGTGSLGVIRVAVLLRDKDGEERIIEMKEGKRPAPLLLVSPPGEAATWRTEGDRVVLAARALAGEPQRKLAAVEGAGFSFSVRRLFPQEDKLAIDTIHPGSKLGEVARTIAHVLGAAHARSAAPEAIAARPVWSATEVAGLVDHAVALGGIFDATYLAYARVAPGP